MYRISYFLIIVLNHFMEFCRNRLVKSLDDPQERNSFLRLSLLGFEGGSHSLPFIVIHLIETIEFLTNTSQFFSGFFP